MKTDASKDKKANHRHLSMKKIVLLFLVTFCCNLVHVAQNDGGDAFENAIELADQYFRDKDYINAKASYQYASRLKPDEEYPQEMLKKTMDLLRDRMAALEQYNAAIAEAEKLLIEGKPEEAIEQFEVASGIIPSENYPQQKISEIRGGLEKEKAIEAAYDEAIRKAEQYFKYGKYEDSKREFSAALEIKPGESYPSEKIAEIEDLLVELRDKEASYDEAISKADRLFDLKYYQEAGAEYERALVFKPEAGHPKSRLEEIEGLMQKKGEFDKLVDEADELYIAKSYEQAKSRYQEALKVFPGESYPEGMIDKINETLNSQKDKEELYANAIADADRFYNDQDWSNALGEYEYALSIKPGSKHAQDRVAEIKAVMEKSEKEEEQYVLAVKTGDAFLEVSEYEKALQEYKNASAVKPDKQYPKERISEIEKLLTNRDAVQQEYDAAIGAGDELMDQKEYDKAIAKYNEALEIIPGREYPQQKINEIAVLREQLAGATGTYEKLIGQADKLFEKKDYQEARARYEEAASYLPDETYPAERIARIDEILSARSEMENAYVSAVSEGDDLFGSGDLENALVKYQEANKLKPGEKYPSQKIDEIAGLLADQKREKETDLQYQEAIRLADQHFDNGDYAGARLEYEKALSIKSGEAHPRERLDQIDSILAGKKEKEETYAAAMSEGQKLMEKEKYEEARSSFTEALSVKPDGQAAQTELDRVNGILQEIRLAQESYQQVIDRADQLFKEKKYEEAKAEYQTALQMKPGEKYPAGRIKEIDKLIQELKLTRQLYADAIKEADDLYNAGEYDKALTAYENAGNYKPTEQYPKERIFQINKMMEEKRALREQYNAAIREADDHFDRGFYEQARSRYTTAADLISSETYPQARMDEIDGILAEAAKEDAEYNEAITRADSHLDAGEYDLAREAYEQALKVKPGETYPAGKIAEIDELLEKLEKRREEYDKLIGEADKLFALKDYEPATGKYEAAAGLMPGESYPTEKIREIESILQAEKDAVENAYNAAIAEADDLFDNKQYEQARTKYQKALGIKPGEAYPQERIGETDRLALDLKTLQANYNKLVSDGDKHFKGKEYDRAKAKFVEASNLLPDEEYPKTKIEEINRIFQTRMKEKQEAYDKAIADADRFYRAKIYDQAIDSYRQAASIMPSESYPEEMIAAISKIIEENAVRDLNNSPITVDDMSEKKFSFDPVSVADRKSNYIYIRARNTGSSEFKVVLSYGKDGNKNGGIIMKIPSGEDENEFIIRVGAQYKWFSEDNNWVSFVPEGGSVEISKVKISKGN